MKPDIRNVSTPSIIDFLEKIGEKKFRATQIEEWLWKKGARSFDAMTNISALLRSQLADSYTFLRLEVETMVQSEDGTAKFIFLTPDNHRIEGVLIPAADRVTACISSQVGCPLKCAFCATGTMGFIRNLFGYEIFDQFVLMNQQAQELYGHAISNIVYMGMGEPLLNDRNVMDSIRWITSSKGQGLSPTRITLSTVGITEGIKRLADNDFKPELAVSLHCADEVKRKQLMPVTHSQSLTALQDALIYFHEKTGKRVTIEYLLLRHWNDTLNDAKKLLAFCRPFPVKINLIEYNATEGAFERTTDADRQAFMGFLQSKNLIVNVRHSRGKDIAAACGQLVKKRKG